MGENPRDLHRRSIRLPRFDYSQAGAYFITIVTAQRVSLLGQIKDNEVCLSKFGVYVQREWERLPQRFRHLSLDEFTIMPNHIHGILILAGRGTGDSPKSLCPGSIPRAPTGERFGHPVAGSIPTIIRSFKSSVTQQWQKYFGGNGSFWQRNYYEHIIRDEIDWERIREYIDANPASWANDRENSLDQSQ